MPNGGLSAPQKRKWRLETELGPGFNKMLLVNGKVRWHCASLFRYNIAISRRCPQPVVCLLMAGERPQRAVRLFRAAGHADFYVALKRANAKAMVRAMRSASIELVADDATRIDMGRGEFIYAGGEGDFCAMVVSAPPTRLKRVLAESKIACSLFEPKAGVIHNMGLPWPTNA